MTRLRTELDRWLGDDWCGVWSYVYHNNIIQELSLWWEDLDTENKTNLLERNITLTITKDQKKGTYGVTHISGTIEVRLSFQYDL